MRELIAGITKMIDADQKNAQLLELVRDAFINYFNNEIELARLGKFVSDSLLDRLVLLYFFGEHLIGEILKATSDLPKEYRKKFNKIIRT